MLITFCAACTPGVAQPAAFGHPSRSRSFQRLQEKGTKDVLVDCLWSGLVYLSLLVPAGCAILQGLFFDAHLLRIAPSGALCEIL